MTSSEQKRGGRTSVGSEDSIERSPLHPLQVKAANRTGASSPFMGSSEGRSRMRAGGRGDETPDKGSSVPKFGEWDESNPSSADNFTGIFEQVREEKKHGSARPPLISNDIIYANDHDSGGSMSCCFRWRKK